ncbi:MAG: hypothetical protein WBA74_23875 [Cyclobacteriaceae bacterium]
MNRYLKIVIITLTIILITVSAFYLYIGNQFGKAAKDGVESYFKLKKELNENQINPIDSIDKQLDILIDSTNSK